MADAGPTLTADASGVWREAGGRRAGIAWGNVFRVSGHKLSGITEVYTCVELDWEYGGHVELYGDWPGFRRAVDAITATLPGIAHDWFERVERLGPTDPPVEVWRRG